MLYGLRGTPLSVAITDKDRRYMDGIPVARKVKTMRRMMCGPPAEEQHLMGNNNYAKVILKSGALEE